MDYAQYLPKPTNRDSKRLLQKMTCPSCDREAHFTSVHDEYEGYGYRCDLCRATFDDKEWAELTGEPTEVQAMSYAVTDAVEDDREREFAVLEQLNEDIDQLAATARDCDGLAPLVKCALDLAWYFAETAMREVGRGSCGHVHVQREPYCACCAHFSELAARAEGLRSRI